MLELEKALDAYRARNMRITPQRRAVITELIGDTSHPTAEEVAERVKRKLPGVSLSTVYKTLNELVELGQIGRVEVRGSMQSARFDPTAASHGHLTCTRCGNLVDIDESPAALVDVRALEKRYGIRIERMHLGLVGLCEPCQRELAHGARTSQPMVHVQ